MANSAMSSATPSRLIRVRAVRRSCGVKMTPAARCRAVTDFPQPLKARPVFSDAKTRAHGRRLRRDDRAHQVGERSFEA